MKKTVLLLLTTPLCLSALGGQPEVVKGAADYKLQGMTETVTVPDKAILEYTKFNISVHETTSFIQPDSKSVLLCRVKGKDPSTIQGQLKANGKLLLINPQGIIFSETAHVKVGTFVASTLDIANEDFEKGIFKFKKDSKTAHASITNKGKIEADHNVLLMSSHIKDQGIITAKMGKIAYLGGEFITLDFDGDKLIQFVVEIPVKNGFIEHEGELRADHVVMRLPAAQKVIKQVLNDEGVIEATQLVSEDGVISLKTGSRMVAPEIDIAASTIRVEGKIQNNQRCVLNADSIEWLRSNQIGSWESTSGQYVIGGAMHVRYHAMVFDAPVFLQGTEVSLLTEGGDIQFKDQIRALPSHRELKLSSQSGDIHFDKRINLNHLSIEGAHNVTAHEVCVEEWSEKNIQGTTTIAGVVRAQRGVSLQGYGLNIARSITVEEGSLSLQAHGTLQSSENIVLTAASIQQKGNAEIVLGGQWLAREGDLILEGKLHLLGEVYLQAPEGNVILMNEVGGLGGLTTLARGFNSHRNIGRIDHLRVEAPDFINVSNIGEGEEGVKGIIHLKSKGSIDFRGTHYTASEHVYQAGQFDFCAEASTTILGRSTSSILFQGGTLHIPAKSALNIHSTLGPIELASIQGGAHSHLTVKCPQNSLYIQRMEGLETLTLVSETMKINAPIDVGSIHLVATKPIYVSHPLTAHTGDFIVQGSVTCQANEMMFKALQGAYMRLEGSVIGNTKLSLLAPEAEVVLKGKIGEQQRPLQQLTIHGKKVSQYGPVYSTGPVLFTAPEIRLGHDILTKNAITFNGPVILFNQDVIHLKAHEYGRGNILFTSSLGAENSGHRLIIENGNSLITITGAIGKEAPLGGLKILSKKVVLNHDIGGAGPGVVGTVYIGKDSTVECYGSLYYATHQEWDTASIHLKHKGAVEIKTNGKPLHFGAGAKLHLDETTSFLIHTEGGRVDLAPVISDHVQPIIVRAGAAEAHLNEIGKHVSELKVQADRVLIGGHLEGDLIFLEAHHSIEYDFLKYKDMIPTALQSTGKITLYSKYDNIGAPDSPLIVQAKGRLEVGASSNAYLKGLCEAQYPYAYMRNPSLRVFFNGEEFVYMVYDDFVNDDILLQTLSPALSHKTSSEFVEDIAIKPRPASIYYETLAK